LMVNRSAGNITKISKDFYLLMSSALNMRKDTGGLYTPFILPQLQRAGYKGSWPNPGQFKEDLDYSDREGRDYVAQLTEDSILLPKDTAVDFGGIGKGYLLDRLACFLIENGIKNFWLSLGGDVICSGNNLENKAWSIGIAKADAPDEILTHVKNDRGKLLAVATSGITKRKGSGWHHIIDPRTGRPAKTDVLTCTVSGGNAVRADVEAKCLVILGSKQAKAYLKSVKLQTVIIQAYKDNKLNVITIRG
jgi:FAD:protein FMN transferase